jgi:hypothetical protein
MKASKNGRFFRLKDPHLDGVNDIKIVIFVARNKDIRCVRVHINQHTPETRRCP